MDLKILLEKIKKEFNKHNIDEVDAEWIFCEVLHCRRSDLSRSFPVAQKQQKQIEKMARARLKKIPLAHILKKRNFFGMELCVSKNVLIPRFETEGLCELVGQKFPWDFGTFEGLDVGTGSGAIAITLSKKYNIKMTAVDISTRALAVAKKNAKLQNVKIVFKRSNLLSNINGSFDVIVSNPPYILSSDVKTLSDEVKKHEPKLALDGGGDGLQFYRKIIFDAPKHLNEGGFLFFEVGKGLAQEVVRMMRKDFEKIVIEKDLQGIDRYVYGRVKTKK